MSDSIWTECVGNHQSLPECLGYFWTEWLNPRLMVVNMISAAA